MSARPSVSVVMPFGGGDTDSLRQALSSLDVGARDELIIADNSGGDAAALSGLARVVVAEGERSSYHARNAGARVAGNEWILFMDADCMPDPGLLASYFEPAPTEEAGAVAGEILGDPAQSSLAARYARDRKVLSQTDGLYGRGRTVAATGNLMVRRTTFEDLGGFVEGIRSGGDIDFCLRLQAAGWRLEFRPTASVRHAHRDSVAGLLGTFARYGAGSRWLNERYPGIAGRWPLSLRELMRVGTDAVRAVAEGQREHAAFRLIDGLGLVAHNVGYVSSNEAR